VVKGLENEEKPRTDRPIVYKRTIRGPRRCEGSKPREPDKQVFLKRAGKRKRRRENQRKKERDGVSPTVQGKGQRTKQRGVCGSPHFWETKRNSKKGRTVTVFHGKEIPESKKQHSGLLCTSLSEGEAKEKRIGGEGGHGPINT